MSAVFREEDGLLVPTGHARGPWAADALHGGAPSAALARAFERLKAPGPMLLARLTVEFLAPVPLAPLELRAEVVRPGRRLQLAEATIVADGREVCRARGVRLRREEVALPGHVRPVARVTPPGGLPGTEIPAFPHGEAENFGATAMELRFAAGAWSAPGASTAWFRLRMPLVEGEEPTGAQRAVAAADFGNGSSAELPFDTHVFVNTDLTVHLSREPVGEWVAVEAVTEHGPEGTALASSALHDEHGPVGRAAQSLFVAAR